MSHPILECRGDPREQGRAQGIAWHAEIQQRVRGEGLDSEWRMRPSLRPLVSGPVLGRGAGRAVVRHYTHLAERMAGLARGSRTPLASVMALFLRSTSRVARHTDLVADALALAHARTAHTEGARGDASGAVLVRTLPGGGGTDVWKIRRSRPEVGFASLELTLPWFVSAVAGVNEAGVTAAVAPGAAPAGGFGQADAAPSAELLVQECLLRFDTLDACIDWCTKRPAGGAAALLLGDARGEVALVSVAGTHRQVLRRAGGSLVGGLPEERRRALEKQLETSGLSVGSVGGEGVASVRVDAAARSLLLDSGDGHAIRTSLVA